MRVNILVPVADIDAANDLAFSVTGNEADRVNTFGVVMLSSDGAEPATHTGCSTYMSESYRVQLPALASQIASLAYSVDDTFSDLLVSEGLAKIPVIDNG